MFLYLEWIDAIDPTDPTDSTDPTDWIDSTWWMDEGFGGDLVGICHDRPSEAHRLGCGSKLRFGFASLAWSCSRYWRVSLSTPCRGLSTADCSARTHGAPAIRAKSTAAWTAIGWDTNSKARTNRRVQSQQATPDTVRLPTVGSRAGQPISRWFRTGRK